MVGSKLLPGDLQIPTGSQTLSELLNINPRLGVESRDDEKCQTLLGELGMLELLTRSQEPNLSVLMFPDHPTHWIVAILWSGHPKHDQNGNRVFCLPKQSIPEEVVKGTLQDVLDDCGAFGQENIEIELPPDRRKGN